MRRSDSPSSSPEPVRLLEVVADELVELGEIGRRCIEAVGVPLVQLGPQSLRRGAIDGLLHEHVPEAEQALPARPHEAAIGERPRCVSAVGAASGSIRATTSSGRELLPDDRASLEHRALAWAEAVETRGEQRLDGLRQRALDEAAFQREREELLEEERVALGGLGDAGALVRLERRSTEALEQRVGLLRRERVEDDPVHVRAPVEE